LFGSQVQWTESIVHESSPHIEAVASAADVLFVVTVIFVDFACVALRDFASGAQTTRHLIEQSTGIVHVLWMLNSTLSSSLSIWSNDVHFATDFVPPAIARGIATVMARAQLAHRAQNLERLQTSTKRTGIWPHGPMPARVETSGAASLESAPLGVQSVRHPRAQAVSIFFGPGIIPTNGESSRRVP
jgi:hypothetical protein